MTLTPNTGVRSGGGDGSFYCHPDAAADSRRPSDDGGVDVNSPWLVFVEVAEVGMVAVGFALMLAPAFRSTSVIHLLSF